MRKNKLLLTLILALGVVLCLLVAYAGTVGNGNDPTTNTSGNLSSQPTATTPTQNVTIPTNAPTTTPTEPPIVKTSTATLGATGDILFHDLVIQSGYVSETDSFD